MDLRIENLAMRQTWEEIGIDLAEKDFMLVGQLDDREITTSLGKRLLMILSPYGVLICNTKLIYLITDGYESRNAVFLQVTPHTPPPDPVPGTVLHWIPVSCLLASTTSSDKRRLRMPRRRWTTVTVDVASRLTPRNSIWLRWIVRVLLGSMQFNAILLDPASDSSSSAVPQSSSDGASGPASDSEKAQLIQKEKTTKAKQETLKLWGLSLGMTLDLIACMQPPSKPFGLDYPHDEVSGLGTSIAPSMT